MNICSILLSPVKVFVLRLTEKDMRLFCKELPEWLNVYLKRMMFLRLSMQMKGEDVMPPLAVTTLERSSLKTPIRDRLNKTQSLLPN